MTHHEILTKARAKIADPDNWGKGLRGCSFDRRPLETCCAAEAIEEVAPTAHEVRRAAMRALYDAAGLEWNKDSIIHWNDAPERTHAEVLAAFDKAIALAKEETAQ